MVRPRLGSVMVVLYSDDLEWIAEKLAHRAMRRLVARLSDEDQEHLTVGEYRAIFYRAALPKMRVKLAHRLGERFLTRGIEIREGLPDPPRPTMRRFQGPILDALHSSIIRSIDRLN